MLGSGAPVQGYGSDTRIPGDLSGFKERDVVIIDAFTHLDGQGNIVARCFFDRRMHNRSKEIGFPRKRRTAAAFCNFRRRAPKVQVDMIRTVFLYDQPNSLTHVNRVYPVNLDGANLLIRIVFDNTHRLGFALHEGTRRHHLGHI